MTPIFIPSYHRADNIKTAKYLHRMGYDMRDVYVFIDDEGGDETKYREACERFGCNLVVFSLREARKKYDFVHRPSKAQRAAGQARNMFADWAKAHNIDFYCVQDDDTTGFEISGVTILQYSNYYFIPIQTADNLTLANEEPIEAYTSDVYGITCDLKATLTAVNGVQ